MKISKPALLSLSLLIGAGVLSSCASTTMKSVQRASDFHSSHIKKVLIVGISNTPGIRELFEEEFVKQWNARGVDAVASSRILPSDVTLDKAGVAPIAKAQGFDCVLVTRVLKRQTIKPQVASPNNSPYTAAAPENEPDLTGYIHAVVASPEYGSESGIEYEVAVLSTNIYDVATEQRLWSGTTQTLVTGDIPKLIRPFIKVILKNIYKTR